MGPVAVILLATLLPGGFLIVGLLWICAYLYSQLRASRAPEDVAEQATDLPEPYVHIRKSQMLDVEMQAWRHDAISITTHLNACETVRDAVGLDKYCKPGDEAWAADLLAELGYKGGLAVPAILCLLRQWDSFKCVEDHIISDVILQRLSLEGDPEDSLLPFTPDVHRGLRDFYKALEETKLCPEIATLVCKIPFQLAEDYSKQHIEWPDEGITEPIRLFNKEVYKRLVYPFSELFGPNIHPQKVRYKLDRTGKKRAVGPLFAIRPDGLDDAVDFHLRMLASRQRFEWRWKGKTTADGAFLEMHPMLQALAGPDGMSLEMPKVWYDPRLINMVEKGCKPLGWEQEEKKDKEENTGGIGVEEQDEQRREGEEGNHDEEQAED